MIHVKASFVPGMAQGHQLSNVEEYRAGNLVFFDFLGAFVIRWPMLIADVINISTVILSVYSIYNNFKEAEVTDSKSVNNRMLNVLHVVRNFRFKETTIQ